MAVLTDPIADFLTRLKNSTMARKDSFSAPHSRIKMDIAAILKEEGYIWSYEQGEDDKGHKTISVTPKYVDKTPALTDLKRISKPGLRRFTGAKEMPRVLGGLGIAIVSTSKGVMSGHRARKENIGGEVLAHVW
jgi:small subunit ribosomal protein S8